MDVVECCWISFSLRHPRFHHAPLTLAVAAWAACAGQRLLPQSLETYLRHVAHQAHLRGLRLSLKDPLIKAVLQAWHLIKGGHPRWQAPPMTRLQLLQLLRSPAPLWAKIFWALSFYTAARPSDLLTPAHILPVPPHLLLSFPYHKTSHGGLAQSPLRILIPPHLQPLVQQLQTQPSPTYPSLTLLFPQCPSTESALKILKAHTTGPIAMYSGRVAATHRISATHPHSPLQQLLHHQRPATTLRYTRNAITARDIATLPLTSAL